MAITPVSFPTLSDGLVFAKVKTFPSAKGPMALPTDCPGAKPWLAPLTLSPCSRSPRKGQDHSTEHNGRAVASLICV